MTTTHVANFFNLIGIFVNNVLINSQPFGQFSLFVCVHGKSLLDLISASQLNVWGLIKKKKVDFGCNIEDEIFKMNLLFHLQEILNEVVLV